MRFLQRDLTKFSLFKPKFVPDGDGDLYAVYDAPAVDEFYGNLQPHRENNSPEAYGIKLKYAYIIYTPDTNIGFQETDRVSDGRQCYEIKAIQDWPGHLRLTVERVNNNE